MAQKTTHPAGIAIPARRRPQPEHSCGSCAARWGGLSTAHCGACHVTFTGVWAFDAHRIGQHEPTGKPGRNVTPGPRRCADPETVGLTDAGRGYPCWGFPTGDERWETDR